MTCSKEEQHRHQNELTKKALSRTQLHLHHGFWPNHHANICVLSLCGICGSEREDSLMMLSRGIAPLSARSCMQCRHSHSKGLKIECPVAEKALLITYTSSAHFCTMKPCGLWNLRTAVVQTKSRLYATLTGSGELEQRK
jgi:hypothetical protein